MPKSFRYAVLVVFALSLIACGKKPAPSPTQTAVPTPPTTPSAAPAPVAPMAPTVSNFAGEWKGNSGENLPLSLSVQGTQVTSLNASYSGQNGSCSFNGSFGSGGPSSINGRSFTAQGKNRGIEFTLNGNFVSDQEASGTIVWKGNSDLCGAINQQKNWTAKKSAPEAPGAEGDD